MAGFLLFCDVRVNGRKMTLSKEEDIEIERKLRILNKPPVKTLQIDCITFDCIEIHKQPALDHPLLINHTIQMRPSSLPVETNPISVTSTMLFGNKLGRKGCPHGTVIIRRTTKENLINSQLFSIFSRSVKSKVLPVIDPIASSSAPANHHFAQFHAYGEDFYGAKGSPTVHGVPRIPSKHGSSAFIILGRGKDETYNATHAGWTVSSTIYGDDRTHFTILWTGLADNAKVIYMGGIAHAPQNEPSPPMGSGHFPEEGPDKAGSFSGIQYIDVKNNFRYPARRETFVDAPNCYRTSIAFDPGLDDGLVGCAGPLSIDCSSGGGLFFDGPLPSPDHVPVCAKKPPPTPWQAPLIAYSMLLTCEARDVIPYDYTA
ncbi:hypothetical protein QJS10_CPA06g01297 [Acorus calamus]|uniref:Neprosin PEP catalytic domain-containing protein n=1 Tax=Acorus calamus TaxID=4465 RepID=A0AAV9EKV2_ACOCL|nr:hypothetical protein QJS10_CPA06g01297 [Acorus calamus]